MPKVTVIIPNYNHASFLQQRLDSVFNQTFQDFEVILLDDASTDGSQNLLKNYENHPKVSHFIINDANTCSPFKQWQKGINLAQGKYIWIAESDDYCEHSFLEKLVPHLEVSGICYAQTIDVDANRNFREDRISYTNDFTPNIWADNFKIEGKDFIKDYLLIKNVIPNASAVVFKKELVDSNLFTERLLHMKMCGDWLFWIQLCQNTYVSFVNKPLNYFRYHKNVSRVHDTIEKRRQRLLEEHDIRTYAIESLNLINTKATETLYNKWFQIHTKFDVFTKAFYDIKLPNINKFTLFLGFIKYKFKLKTQ